MNFFILPQTFSQIMVWFLSFFISEHTLTFLLRSAPVNISSITECNQYKNLPKGKSISGSRLWDKIEDVSCDEGDNIYGWYRYALEEGGEMAGVCLENQNSTGSLFGQPCGANFRGWMMDKHPKVEDGRVQRRVCFSYDKRCYCEFYKNIAVRNCGGYYVYRLSPIKTCNSRYCGAPSNQLSKGMTVHVLLFITLYFFWFPLIERTVIALLVSIF